MPGLGELGKGAEVLHGECLVHMNSEPELGIGDGLAMVIERSQLIGSQLPEPVIGFDTRICVDAQEFYALGVSMPETGKDMGKHGLVKQACVKPEQDMVVLRGLRQRVILLLQRLQNVLPM